MVLLQASPEVFSWVMSVSSSVVRVNVLNKAVHLAANTIHRYVFFKTTRDMTGCVTGGDVRGAWLGKAGGLGSTLLVPQTISSL
jgi:hypothetical protein